MSEPDHRRIQCLQQCSEVGPATAFCPEDQLIAEYFDGQLENPERSRLERHLSVCRLCRARVGVIARLQDTRREPRIPASALASAKQLPFRKQHGRLPKAAAWAVAASIAIASVIVLNPRERVAGPATSMPAETMERPARQLRSTDADAHRLRLLTPTAGDEVGAGAVLRWNRIQGTVHYEIRILNRAGDLLLSTRTSSPMWPLEDSFQLQPGENYYVLVEATLDDGRRIPSRHVLFTYAGERQR